MRKALMVTAILGIAGALLYAGVSDPSPRIVYLGEEYIKQPDIQGEPARVFFYKDAATNDEIVCFTGNLRETLSCFKTGRIR
jgi:hypothetical protein